MKIAQITPNFYPSIGGVESVVYNTAKHLTKRGHDLEIFTFKPKGFTLKPKGHQTFPFKTNRYSYTQLGGWRFRFSTRLLRDLRKKRFDIVHFHCYGHLMNDILLSTPSDNKVLTLHRGPTDNLASTFGRNAVLQLMERIYDKTLGRMSLHLADLLIAITPQEMHWIKKQGVKSEKTRVIPNGISCKDVDDDSQLSRFKEKYGLKDNVILFLSRICLDKGIDILLKTIPNILQEKPNTSYLFVGPIEDTEKLLKSAKEKFGSHVVITGPLFGYEKALAYKSSTIFVLPTKYEIFATVCLEAQYHGIPVLVTNFSGAENILDDGNTGFLMKDRENVHKWVDKIIRLLDVDNRNSYRKKAKEFAKHFLWENIVVAVEASYKELLEKNIH